MIQEDDYYNILTSAKIGDVFSLKFLAFKKSISTIQSENIFVR
jgi:hypothetical protein